MATDIGSLNRRFVVAAVESRIHFVVTTLKFRKIRRDAKMFSDTVRVEVLLDLADGRVAKVFCHVWTRLADIVLKETFQTNSATLTELTGFHLACMYGPMKCELQYC